MAKRRRLRADERKREIQEVAIRLFNEKGYGNCTLTDIIEASGLSRGGFYHHYHDKVEILYDLMMAGNMYRISENNGYISEHAGVDAKETLVEITLNRILDENELKNIYVMLLQEMRRDKALRELYDKLYDGSIELMSRHFEECGLKVEDTWKSDFFNAFLNSLFLGMYALDAKEIFEREKDTLRKVFRVILGG